MIGRLGYTYEYIAPLACPGGCLPSSGCSRGCNPVLGKRSNAWSGSESACDLPVAPRARDSPAQQHSPRHMCSIGGVLLCGVLHIGVKMWLHTHDKADTFGNITRDTVLRQYGVPEDKLVKIEKVLREAVTSNIILLATLEKIVGKCTSMSVAVPAASLYTHSMYIQIAKCKKTGDREIAATIEVSRKYLLAWGTQAMVRGRSKN